MDKYTPNQKMFYYRKKKEKKNSEPTNPFELYICTQQAIVCGWMMIFDALDISSNMVICLSPCTTQLYTAVWVMMVRTGPPLVHVQVPLVIKNLRIYNKLGLRNVHYR